MEFEKDFEENKKLLEQTTQIDSIDKAKGNLKA